MPYCCFNAGKGPGKVSDYIYHAKDLHERQRVMEAYRVSGRAQQYNGNLADQRKSVGDYSRERRFVKVGEISYVGNGNDPTWLSAAAMVAKQENAVILVESPSRSIRPLDYHPSKNPTAQPTKQDLENLREATRGVRIHSIEDPSATPEKERSVQTKRGLIGKNRKRGAYKKQQREALLPKALLLHRQGKTFAGIAGALSVPLVTAWRWVKRGRE